MHLLSDFTLLVPTHNRSEKLISLINLLSTYKHHLKVLFLDSSAAPAKNKNRSAIELKLNNNVDYSYFEFEEDCDPFQKFYFGISKVKTKYCAFCADDDIVLLESIEEILKFLEKNPPFVAAHGYYFGFQVDPLEVHVRDIVYYKNNLSGGDLKKRIHSLFSDYESTFYATYRTSVIKDFFALALQMETTLWKELILSLSSIMAGKIYRIPNFYYGRRMGESLPFSNWHPYEIFGKEPELYFKDYLKAKKLLFNHFYGTTPLTHEKKLFDLSHLFYLKKYLDPKQLDAVWEGSFENDVSKKQVFYENQKNQADCLDVSYKKRRISKYSSRLFFSFTVRELFLPLGYKLTRKFSFLKPLMKKVAEWVLPNITIKNLRQKSLAKTYTFGNEFFLRDLPRGHRPARKDMEFIIGQMENYIS